MAIPQPQPQYAYAGAVPVGVEEQSGKRSAAYYVHRRRGSRPVRPSMFVTVLLLLGRCR